MAANLSPTRPKSREWHGWERCLDSGTGVFAVSRGAEVFRWGMPDPTTRRSTTKPITSSCYYTYPSHNPKSHLGLWWFGHHGLIIVSIAHRRLHRAQIVYRWLGELVSRNDPKGQPVVHLRSLGYTELQILTADGTPLGRFLPAITQHRYIDWKEGDGLDIVTPIWLQG